METKAGVVNLVRIWPGDWPCDWPGDWLDDEARPDWCSVIGCQSLAAGRPHMAPVLSQFCLIKTSRWRLELTKMFQLSSKMIKDIPGRHSWLTFQQTDIPGWPGLVQACSRCRVSLAVLMCSGFCCLGC